LRASAAERIEHSVITLVACVFKILVARFLSQGKSDFERADISLRIVDGHFVLQFVRADTREPFSQFESVGRRNAATVSSGDSGSISQKICGFDYKRRAFPVTARISHI